MESPWVQARLPLRTYFVNVCYVLLPTADDSLISHHTNSASMVYLWCTYFMMSWCMNCCTAQHYQDPIGTSPSTTVPTPVGKPGCVIGSAVGTGFQLFSAQHDQNDQNAFQPNPALQGLLVHPRLAFYHSSKSCILTFLPRTHLSS